MSTFLFLSNFIPFLYIIFVYQIWNSFHFCGHNLKVGDQMLVLAPRVIINDDRLYPQILGHHHLTWDRSALPANPTSSRPRSWFLGNATLVVAERNGWWRVLGALKPRPSAKRAHPYRKRACLEALRLATTKLTQPETCYLSWGHPTQLRISRGSIGITTDHKEGEEFQERRNVGESSCKSGDGTDQREQSLMFMMMMMMMMNLKVLHNCYVLIYGHTEFLVHSCCLLRGFLAFLVLSSLFYKKSDWNCNVRITLL
jgi:hypothetical protein